jgi:hypothetical protein
LNARTYVLTRSGFPEGAYSTCCAFALIFVFIGSLLDSDNPTLRRLSLETIFYGDRFSLVHLLFLGTVSRVWGVDHLPRIG